MNWRFWKKKKEIPSPQDMVIRVLLNNLANSAVLGTETAIGYFNYVLKAQKEGYPIEDFEKKAEIHEKLIAQHFDRFLRTMVSIAIAGSGNIIEYIDKFSEGTFNIAGYCHAKHRGGIEVLMAKMGMG